MNRKAVTFAALLLGSERPKYQGHDETAYAKNRRDDLVVR